MVKVSVIIPVYNVEKYLDECLDSIVNQSLKDIEIICINDGSTDNSLKILEKYESLDDRIRVFSQENSGLAATRNSGMNHSSGEYIYFMDDDDLLVDTALETLYNFAENYQADVVYMERGYLCDEEIFPETFTAAAWDKNLTAIDKPTLETENISERIDKFLQTHYGWAPWIKFLSRDFLITNKIKFPKVKIAEDVLWTFKVICLAKNFLRIPSQLYICRSVKNSWSRVERSLRDEIKFRLNPLINGLEYLETFMDNLKFFEHNPNYRFKVTNFFVKMQLAGMLNALDKLDNDELYEIFHREISAVNGKDAALISNLIIFMNYYRRNRNQ